jgi:LCP family protein required for cell wall assembly
MHGRLHPDRQGRAPRPRGREDRASGRAYGGQPSGYGERPTSRPPGVYGARASRPGQRPDRAGRRGGDDPEQAPAAARERRRRRRTPIWAALTVTAGALLMLLSGTAIAGYEMLSNRYLDDNVQQENLLGDAAADPGKELEGPINLLLLGVEEQGEGARSDSILVLHIPASHDQAYLISFPRDTLVSVPGYWDMKITEAFDVGYDDSGGEWGGGAQLVASVLSNLTGVQFDGAAIVNFGGFQNIIDELGGIELCLDTAAYSEHLILVDGEPVGVGRARREGLYGEQVTYEEGCQTLPGWQALDYARQRKTLADESGDYGRQRHQRQLLKAMADAVYSRDVVTNIGKLDGLIRAGGDALTVDTNGIPLADFVFTLRDVGIGDLVALQTNGGEFNSFQIDGKSYEQLSEESLDMFEAAANDTMAQFVLNHPDFVSEDG